MKTITTILLVLTVLCVQAQEKFSAGFQVEGIQSMPKNSNFPSIARMGNSYGGGIGAYFSATIWKSISANTGLNYRTVSYDCSYDIFNSSGQSSSVGSCTYRQNWLVVPFNLRKSFLNNWLFVEPGIELNWILGHEQMKHKNEMLWKIGIGSKFGKLNYSLNYLWGNKEQLDFLYPDGNFKIVNYNTRMLQLKVSYPLWQKNK